MNHELKRCVFTEKDIPNKLWGSSDRWWKDIDEICNQLYADDMGRGINGKP